MNKRIAAVANSAATDSKFDAVELRMMRKLRPETNAKLMLVSDVLKHLKEQPETTPEDFLKEDYRTSPCFKKDPEYEQLLNQVQFADNRQSTVNRSHLGTSALYADYEALVKAEKDKKFKAMIK